MRKSSMGMGTRVRTLIGGGATALTLGVMSALATAAPAWAAPLMGQPTPGGISLQPAAAPLKHDAHWFHDWLLLPIIIAISLLVLGLLVWIAIRYNKKANPVPAKWSHNTLIEVVWTIVPVLILIVIAVPSFRLLYKYHDAPPAELTVKVTGNQWNWTYEYPDQGIAEYYSNMLPEDQARARGVPFRLAADEPMVVPVNRNVELLITASDVIHAVALPAFGLKTDAVPGRINKTWFRAERTGVFYGQCSELCGVDHAFMPIQINVVNQAEFEAWVASKGGSMTPPPAAGAAPASPAVTAPQAAPAAGEVVPTPETTPAAGATAAPAPGRPAVAAAGAPAASAQTPAAPAAPRAQ